MKNNLRRLTAAALAAVMSLGLSMQSYAAGLSADYNEEEALRAEAYVSDEYAAKFPNGNFGFREGDMTVNIDEGDGYRDIYILRKGGTEGEASVKFRAVDITAQYGKNYDIELKDSFYAKHAVVDPEMEPLINQYADEDNYGNMPLDEAISAEAAGITLSEDMEGDISLNDELYANVAAASENIELSQGTETEETETETEALEQTTEAVAEVYEEITDEQSTEVPSEDGSIQAETAWEVGEETSEEITDSAVVANASSLASAYSAYTGSSPVKNDWRTSINANDDEVEMYRAYGEIADDAMLAAEEYMPAAELELHFADGEYAKRIRINIHDDDLYCGDLQFATILIGNEGASLEVQNNGSVNITENDAKVGSLFRIDGSSLEVTPDEDSVRVTVYRTKGTEHLDTIVAYTEDGTATAGKDYEEKSERLIFIGGIVSRSFEVKLNKNRTEGTSFKIKLESGDNVDRSSDEIVINLTDESVQLASEDDVSLAAGCDYTDTSSISANASGKNGSSRNSKDFDYSWVRSAVIHYSYDTGTKKCRSWHYDGSSSIYVNGTVHNLGTLRGSGSGSLTLNKGSGGLNGELKNITVATSNSGKNTKTNLRVTSIDITYDSVEIKINNKATETNSYLPRYWSATKGAELYTMDNGRKVYADKKEQINGTTRYYNTDPTDELANHRIADLVPSEWYIPGACVGEDVSYTTKALNTVSLSTDFNTDDGWNTSNAYLSEIRITKGSSYKSIKASDGKYSISLDKNFYSTYKDYITNENGRSVINLVPVYTPRMAVVKLVNNPDDSGYTDISGDGLFFVRVTDKLAIEGYAKGGSYVKGFSFSKYSQSDNSKDFEDLIKSAAGNNYSTKFNYDPETKRTGYEWSLQNTDVITDSSNKDYTYSLSGTTKVMMPVNDRYIKVTPVLGDTSLVVGPLPNNGNEARLNSLALFYDNNGQYEAADSSTGKITVLRPTMGQKYVFRGLFSSYNAGSISYADFANTSAELLKATKDYYDSQAAVTEASSEATTSDEIPAEYLQNKSVSLINSEGTVVETAKTNALGSFSFTSDSLTDGDYTLKLQLDSDGKYTAEAAVKVTGGKLAQSTSFTVQTNGAITSAASSIDYNRYMLRWRDGTLSDGGKRLDNADTAYAKALGIDTNTYYGNVFTYVFSKYYASTLYYDIFVPDESKLSYPVSFLGKMSVRNTELYTQKSVDEPIVGAAISIGDDVAYTDSDGKFEMNFEKGYDKLYPYSMIADYNGMSYGTSITADTYTDYVIDAQAVVKLSNGSVSAYRNGCWSKVDFIKDPMDFNNGDCTYRLTAEVQSKSQLVVPQRVEVKLYTKDGILIDTQSVNISNNMFTFELNPAKYTLNGSETALEPGTTFRFTVYDQNGIKYNEVPSGIKLEKYVDKIGIDSSFDPGFKTVDMIGDVGLNANSSGGVGGNDQNARKTVELTRDDIDALTANAPLFTDNSSVSLSGSEQTDDTALSEDNGDVSLSSDFDTVKSGADAGGVNYLVIKLGIGYSGDGEGYSSDDNGNQGNAAQNNDGPLKTAIKDAFTSSSNLGKAFEELKKEKERTANSPNKANAVFKHNVTFEFSFSFRMGLLKNSDGDYKMVDLTLVETANVGDQASMSLMAGPVPIICDGGIEIFFNGYQIFIKKVNKDFAFDESLGTYDMGDLIDGTNNLVNKGDYYYNSLEVGASINLFGGVGFTMFKVQVGGTFTAKFQYTAYDYTPDEAEEANGNTKIEYKSRMGSGDLTATVRIKAFIFNFSLDFAHKKFDWGEKVTTSGDVNVSADGLQLADNDTMFLTADEAFEREDLSYLDGREGWVANDNITLASDRKGLSENVLMDKIYEDAEPSVINLDNGKYLAVFADKAGDSSVRIYYTINSDGVWSTPKLLDSDAETDKSPVLLDLGDRVAMAWSDVDNVDENDVSGTLNSLEVKLSFFDKSSDSFGEVYSVTHTTSADKYADGLPRLATGTQNGKPMLMVYYFKTNYTNKSTVGDVLNAESYLASRMFDLSSNTFIDDYSSSEVQMLEDNNSSLDVQRFNDDWYGQRFVDLAPKLQVNEEPVLNEDGTWSSEPQINLSAETAFANALDYSVTTYNNYGIIAYTLDEDDNLDTNTDRALYMVLYDFNNDTFSSAVKLSDSDQTCYSPRFTQVDGKTMLLWGDNDGIKATDIGYVIDNCLTQYTIGTITSDILDKMEDGSYDEPTLLVANEENNIITEFGVQSDGNDVAYLTYLKNASEVKDGVDENSLDVVENENQVTGTNIYLVRYTVSDDTLSEPVVITGELGTHYSNLAFDVSDDNMLRAIATRSASTNVTVQDESGNTDTYVGEDTTARSLIDISYNLAQAFDITSFTAENVIYNDSPKAVVDVKNCGFLDGSNMSLAIKDENGTVVAQQDGIAIASGETQSFVFDMPTLTQTSGEYKLVASLTDSEGAEVVTDDYNVPLAANLNIVIDDYEYILHDIIVYSFTATNNGNVPSSDELKLYINDELSEEFSVKIDPILPNETLEDVGILTLGLDNFQETDSSDGHTEYAAIRLVGDGNSDGGKIDVDRHVSKSQIDNYGTPTEITSPYNDSDKPATVAVGGYLDLQLATDDENSNAVFVCGLNDEILDFYEGGIIRGVKPGNAELLVYAIPPSSKILLGEKDSISINNVNSIPSEYVLEKVISINVLPEGETASTEATTEATTAAHHSSGGSGGSTRLITSASQATTEFETVSEVTTSGINGNETAAEHPFRDIIGSWCENAVTELYKLGIVSGVSEDSFAPNTNIKRGDFVMLLMKLFESEKHQSVDFLGTAAFDDVSGESYYYKSIMQAKRLGIAKGYGDNTFKPDEPITREEMAALADRTLKLLNKDTDEKTIEFEDLNEISAYAYEPISRLTGLGIISGFTDNTFRPHGLTTRAEAAQVISKIKAL